MTSLNFSAKCKKIEPKDDYSLTTYKTTLTILNGEEIVDTFVSDKMFEYSATNIIKEYLTQHYSKTLKTKLKFKNKINFKASDAILNHTKIFAIKGEARGEIFLYESNELISVLFKKGEKVNNEDLNKAIKENPELFI